MHTKGSKKAVTRLLNFYYKSMSHFPLSWECRAGSIHWSCLSSRCAQFQTLGLQGLFLFAGFISHWRILLFKTGITGMASVFVSWALFSSSPLFLLIFVFCFRIHSHVCYLFPCCTILWSQQCVISYLIS